MPIVSISLTDELLAEMERVQSNLGFTGRSELIRTAVRMLIADKKAKEELFGDISCVLAVTHDEESEEPVTSLKHEFERIIRTHLHSKLGGRKCLEIFLLEGKAEEVREISRRFQVSRDMDYVRLILA